MFGTRIMRVRAGVIQSPVLRFRDSAGGRTVTLIGTLHVGEAQYFQRIRDLACELEAGGAVVQYEKVRRSPEEEWAAATDEERAARDAHNARVSERSEDPLLAGLQRYLGWEYQGDALVYSPTWQNTDISTLEYVRLVGPADFLASHDASARVLAAAGDARVADLSGPSAVILFRLLALDRYRLIVRFLNRAPSDRARSAAEVEARNRTALQALPATGDTVMLWGSHHLAGLREGLKAAGFAQVGRANWLDIGELPGTWACVRELRAAIRQGEAGMLARRQEPEPR